MHIVYFSHSYRPEDSNINSYFAELIGSQELIPSLDPPSESVNAAKLERHMKYSDGMVAILTQREGGPSKHILFEISLCLRARKPILVFVEDVLATDVIPSRILQRRFSRKSFLRQIREHQHALSIMKIYMGQAPPPKYQPSISKKSCLVIGSSDMPGSLKDAITYSLENNNYESINMDDCNHYIYTQKICDEVASADLAVSFIDTDRNFSHCLIGAAQFALVPTILLTINRTFDFNPYIPKEYQARIMDASDESVNKEILCNEIELCEEDFLELKDKEKIEKYMRLLFEVSSSTEGAYSKESRRTFINNFSIFTANQVGAQGQNAGASSMTFNQKGPEI